MISLVFSRPTLISLLWDQPLLVLAGKPWLTCRGHLAPVLIQLWGWCPKDLPWWYWKVLLYVGCRTAVYQHQPSQTQSYVRAWWEHADTAGGTQVMNFHFKNSASLPAWSWQDHNVSPVTNQCGNHLDIDRFFDPVFVQCLAQRNTHLWLLHGFPFQISTVADEPSLPSLKIFQKAIMDYGL